MKLILAVLSGMVLVLAGLSASLYLSNQDLAESHPATVAQMANFTIRTGTNGTLGVLGPIPASVFCPSKTATTPPLFLLVWKTSDGRPVSYFSMYTLADWEPFPYIVIIFNQTNASFGSESAYSTISIQDGVDLCNMGSWFQVAAPTDEVVEATGILVYNSTDAA